MSANAKRTSNANTDSTTGKANNRARRPSKKAKRAAPKQNSPTKLQTLIDLLHRPEGATLDHMVKATGWQRHSVRGALSGALKKKRGLNVTAEVIDDRGRVYRIGGTT